MAKHRIYATSVGSVYPHYVAKAKKKGRTRAEVDEIIRWLTGHSQATLDEDLAKGTNFEDFFALAPRMNPRARRLRAPSAAFASRTSRSPRCAKSATSTS